MPIIKPSLHHVTFRTSRLQEMIDWYAKVIGVTVTFQDEYNAWTTNDAANHRVAFLSVSEIVEDPDKFRHNCLHHSAFEYDGLDALMESYSRMAGEGITPAFCLHHGITISIYYRDPDRNFVELQVDNFGNWAQSTRWMQMSEDFRANPIGAFFDPEKVLQAHRAGTDFETLSRAIRHGDYKPDVIPNIGLPEPDAVLRGL